MVNRGELSQDGGDVFYHEVGNCSWLDYWLVHQSV